ncbi:uncharacterized protein TRUGW13939_09687 [Talaromyces rugulosus]|uniref:Uncharacterized protein n=1 Tax=Talaromyces rugulosus TaxID=121627 RepID=A0A7H8R8D6_TALRU|nr:uncharacterized protein TRUGW13939_09687 [Talaromyces rugulosus]QKX62526.1 hypothetical protein TRUGW13939_09687 [Talaromyces rugulosus]
MASQRKSHVFRVTGFSRDRPDPDLQKVLQETLQDHFTDDERTQVEADITIVPSCYEADTQRVALVRFRGGIPQFLSELRVDPLGDWQVEMGDCDINFDCHFFGFTQLYAPDEQEPVVADIIAIAGLDGHAYGSWQGRGNLGRMWLRDFLSKDLPQCRTMIYGYNSKLSSHGVDTILDYGRELMEEIKKIRNTKEIQQRPLFFIAHSFGGIILAHVVRAIQTMEEDHPAITSLHRATYGLILFAIPHKGLIVNDMQQMLSGGNHLRQHLLQQISSKSDLLVHQLAEFKNLIRDRKVVSFYETEQTRQLDRNGRQWRRAGDFITTVDADSALLQLPDHVEDKVPLHADHSMIVKFDSRSAPEYRTALDKLQQFARDAPQVVAARFKRPETPLSPLSTVPFTRDPDFVRSESPATWVFWVHASNAARFEQSFRDIADRVKISGRQDPHANIFGLVENWLHDKKRERWVLVLDNVDDHEFLRKSPATGLGDPNSLMNASTKPLLEYLPRSLNGSVIITSRTREVALKMVDDKDIIEVKPMERSEALELLQRKLEQPGESQESRDLVEELELMPLAIVQAASYIRNRAPRCSVSQYLRHFQKNDCKATKLLETEPGNLYRDLEAKNSILLTWQKSFDHIRQTEPSAADLLSLMSFFDRQGIPEKLLRVQPENSHILSSDLLNDCSSDDGEVSESDTVDNFENDIAILRNFSFISVGKNSVFTMHRLVQLTTREWLKTHNQMEQWKERFISNLYYMFPIGDYENWEICRLLFPHVKLAISQRPKSQESLRNWATLLYNGASYALTSGNVADGRDMASKSMKQRVSVLGGEDRGALESTEMLAVICMFEGDWKVAEKLLMQAMETCKTKLGEDHRETLTVMAILAGTFGAQGRLEEAEKIQLQLMEIQKRELAEDYPNMLPSIATLETIFGNQGRLTEAKRLLMQVIEIQKRKLGVDHPITLMSMTSLALAYQSQGRLEEAERLLMQVIEIQKRKLGVDHPITLTSMASLALAYQNQGRLEEAEKLEVQVMETRKTKLGKDHPNTLTSMANLASTYQNQGRLEEAEKLEVQVMETRKTKLGKDHPDTLTSMANLASTYQNQGRLEEAEKLLVQVIETRKTKLGDDHPDTLTSMSGLAITLWNQGWLEEAEKLLVQVMETRKTKLGEDHPDTLRSMANLAFMELFRTVARIFPNGNYASWAQIQTLLAHAKSVLAPIPDIGDEDRLNIAKLLSHYGWYLDHQGVYNQVEVMYRRALEAREKVLGLNHPNTLTSVNNLGNVLFRQGKYDQPLYPI